MLAVPGLCHPWGSQGGSRAEGGSRQAGEETRRGEGGQPQWARMSKEGEMLRGIGYKLTG